MEKADIGIYGLGVMGANLALNFEQKGYAVAVYNRTVPGKEENIVDKFLEKEGEEKNFIGTFSEKELIASLKPPRKILLMVKAGRATDHVIDQLTPLLDEDDILIDGGNAHYRDTSRRLDALSEAKIHFVGMGVSGGEEGARNGPSLMPGGSPKAWKKIRSLLESIAAKDPDGRPCCGWVGEGGAGHFVKMVHNGIEYADMQLIAETYHLMKTGLDMKSEEIASVFDTWNEGELNSYLLEITADILKAKDEDGTPLVEKILDTARQKGTGRWTSISALELGTPLPSITSAVYTRVSSSLKSLRVTLSGKLKGPYPSISAERKDVLNEFKHALYAARVIVLAEGFFLIQRAAREYGWNINQAEIARIWQNGCIIRSELLKPVREFFLKNSEDGHLLANDLFGDRLEDTQGALRNTLSLAISHGIPSPAMSNALSQYDTLRSEWLPANLIQAQRDYFGAHQYERHDQPRGTFFHTEWAKLIKRKSN